MPKIIIRENDYTQAGTPEYSNFTVLIAGFAKDGVNAGTVFEFSTQAEFVEKVGHVKYVARSKDNSEAVDTSGNKIYKNSYGNKIAYELLGLGYPVIYKVITNVSDMNSDVFWEEFKDKASYDFRYIMTGLLEDNKTANEQIIKLAKFDEKATDVFATGRGDCIALCDIDKDFEQITSTTVWKTEAEEIEKEDGQTETVTKTYYKTISNAASTASKYAAYFAPSFCMKSYEPKDGKGEKIYNDNKFPVNKKYLT